MKVCIVVSHPAQFDVPVYRMGAKSIHVIYTSKELCRTIYDKELGHSVNWEGNLFDKTSFSILACEYAIFELFLLLKKGDYDLIITCGYNKVAYIFSLLFGRILSNNNGLRLDSILNNKSKFNNLFRSLWWKYCVRNFCNCVFVVGSQSKKFAIKQGFRNDQIGFFGYLCDPSIFNLSPLSSHVRAHMLSLYSIPDNKRILLCVSKHIPRESPWESIRAFEKLNDDELSLILVGDGIDNENLRNYVKNRNLKNVLFLGYIPFVELWKLYHISDVFIHDSKDEPWGVSVEEALRCGIPVVASNNVGSSYDLIHEGRNGYQYVSGDIVDLATKIKLALEVNKSAIVEFNRILFNEWNYYSIINSLSKYSSIR
jgi:glycosyltransferase involved in cell wall biosynthesis